MASMNLEIVTPAGSKLTESVEELTAPGALGELGVLPGHIPVLTVLDVGRMSYAPSGGGDRRLLAVNGGFLEVEGNKLIVITETAEFAEEIDVERARKALERAETDLARLAQGSAEMAARLRARRRAQVRLEVAGG